MCPVWHVAFKMTERVERWICIKFCIKLEHSSSKAIQVIQKATAMGNWWLAASSQECACSSIMSCAEFSGETSNYPGDSVPLQPRFGTLRLLAFPQTKISDHWWDFRKYDWATGGNCENCVRSQGAYFERDRGVIVLCTFLVSSSINISIFHITWLDIFWADLIFPNC